MALMDLRGTTAQNCKITELISEALLDASNLIERVTSHDQTEESAIGQTTNAKDKMLNKEGGTPSVLLRLSKDDVMASDTIVPRNLGADFDLDNP